MTQHQHHHHHHHPHRHHIHRHEEDSSDEESDYTPSASATSSRSTRRRTRTVPTNHESNSVVTPTSTNYYRCLWRHPTPCTLLFTSWDALFQHLADDHVGWAKNKNLCLQCYWSDCQEPEKKKRDHLISHVRSHLPGFRPFLCPVCSHLFFLYLFIRALTNIFPLIFPFLTSLFSFSSQPNCNSITDLW